MKPRTLRITVSGRGTFPIDMLRHDRMWPATEQDSGLIEHERGERTVDLYTVSDMPLNMVATQGRWKSFGWEVERVVQL